MAFAQNRDQTRDDSPVMSDVDFLSALANAAEHLARMFLQLTHTDRCHDDLQGAQM